ncbi:unnamed protein product [Closterium sp. NIES-64]|nr:unnamed protein product [Closterium sp. NIES-64]
MDAKVLSFGDVLLRECDVATLESSQWLNDKIIEFYFEYLSRTLLAASDPSASAAGAGAAAGTASSSAGGESSSNGAGGAAGGAAGGEGNNSAVLLVGPSVSFWLNICPSDDDVTETMAPLGVENKESTQNTKRSLGAILIQDILPHMPPPSPLPHSRVFTAPHAPRRPCSQRQQWPNTFSEAGSASSHSQSTTTTTPHSFNAVPPHFLAILSPSLFACLCMAAHRTRSQRQQRPHTRSMHFPLTSSLSSPPLPLLASAWQLIALAVNDNNDPTLVQCCSPSLPRYPLPLSLACLCMAALRTRSQRQQRPHTRSMLFPLTFLSILSPSSLLASAWQLIALPVNDNNDPTLVQCCSPSLPRYPLPLSLCLPLHGSSSHLQSTTTTTPHSFNAVPPHFLAILSPLPLLASAWQLIALAVNDNNDPTLVQCCSPSLPRYPLPLSLCLPLHGSSSHLQSTTTTTPLSFNAVPPHFLAILSPLPLLASAWQLIALAVNDNNDPHLLRQARTGVSSSSSGQLGLVPLPLHCKLHTSVAVPRKVNGNNSHTLADAGSHWILLHFIRSRRLFLHFDSAGSHNLEAAKGLAEKLQALLDSGRGDGWLGWDPLTSNEAAALRLGEECG